MTRYGSGSVLHGARMFGEADFLNVIKRASNVAAVSDYASGISINGSDPSQTTFSIDDVPLFFPYRFGGVFSVFSTPQF